MCFRPCLHVPIISDTFMFLTFTLLFLAARWQFMKQSGVSLKVKDTQIPPLLPSICAKPVGFCEICTFPILCTCFPFAKTAMRIPQRLLPAIFLNDFPHASNRVANMSSSQLEYALRCSYVLSCVPNTYTSYLDGSTHCDRISGGVSPIFHVPTYTAIRSVSSVSPGLKPPMPPIPVKLSPTEVVLSILMEARVVLLPKSFMFSWKEERE
mmetsp:Transcript_41567/g.107609  ORF Transcript_41567/g.107609 Transcript_41567/m.107609 type:complete len:210 (-) Transcript_41567:157-786(-)